MVGILRYAMANGYDIKCDAPVGEDLLYNLTRYLIPSLAKYGEGLHATQIHAVPDPSELSNFGAVGTGASLGIDSLYSIINHLNSGFKYHDLTHLVLNNVGAYDPVRGVGQFDWKLNNAKRFADEIGLPLIEVNSNIADILSGWNCYYFNLTHSYCNAFAVLALQKFFKIYYYSSCGHDFSYFSLFHINDHDSSDYDLLSLPCFSSQHLRFYPDGGAQSRVEKTRDVVSFPLSRNFLHVCTDDRGPNCGQCSKCKRTLVTLDALDALYDFSKVFNVDYYKAHRSEYIQWLLMNELRHGRNTFTGEAYDILKQRGDITLHNSVVAWIRVVLSKVHPKYVIIPRLKRFFRL